MKLTFKPIFLAFFTACLLLSSAVHADKKPNIILYLVDDMGAMDMSGAGSQLYETPNIDQLAADGVKFANAYSAHPRCVPSRVGILSGQVPARYGVPGFQNKARGKHALGLGVVTFAERLQQAGYDTGYIGKWHLGKKGGDPSAQGFSESILAGVWGAPPSYYYPFDKAKRGKGKGFPKNIGKEGDYLIDHMNDLSADYVTRHKDNPFLLVMAHYAVHTPIEGKKELITKYRKKLKASGVPAFSKNDSSYMIKDGTGYYNSQHNNAGYAAMVESMDQGVGILRKRLADLGIADNTIIIFTSDHGGLSSRGLKNKREVATSNLPYRHGKGWLYDGGLRVPLIVQGKDIPAGKSVNRRVTGTDHYPTILQLAGVPLDKDAHKDGLSYIEALKGADTPREKPLFFHSSLGRPKSTGDTASSALIDGNNKIICWYVHNKCELFDLSKDIGEHKDLSKSNPALFQAMKMKLDAYIQNANAKVRKDKMYEGY